MSHINKIVSVELIDLLTGTHFALEEIRSRVVTGLVASSAHFTSRVNSTAQSGQKS